MFGLPETLQAKTVDNYEPQSPHQAAGLRIVKGITSNSDEVNLVRGLWLHGPFGTGKTSL
jgi:predicted ATPase